MDSEMLAQRLGLEVDEYIELIQLFLETGFNNLKGLEDGLLSNDIQVVVERAHSLKGASGNLGLTEIYEKVKDVENRALDNNLDGIDGVVIEIRQYLKNIVDSL